MSNKLLLNPPASPEYLPVMLNEIIQDNDPTTDIRLVQDDETTYTLSINQQVKKQIFPRFHL